jgi:hypothetical protein
MSERDRACRILGLETDATLDEMREAYQDLKAVWHPDRFSDNPELKAKAEGKQEAVESAYKLLRDDYTSRKQKRETSPPVPQNGESGRGPSILDDTLSERTGTSKKWLPVWLVLFGIVAVGVVISFLTWSPVEVESDAELSEEEKIVAEVQGARPDTQELQDDSVSEELELGEVVPETDVGGTPEEILQDRRETRIPEQPSEVIASPPIEPRIEPKRTPPPEPKVAQSSSQLSAEPDLPPASPQSEESTQPTEEIAQEEAAQEEQPTSELAERAFQILRAKSELANRLVEGGFSDYGFLDWKGIERGSTEVYVDLLAESVSDGREVHFVWAVNLETQSVKAMSQAARDLQAEDR